MKRIAAALLSSAVLLGGCAAQNAAADAAAAQQGPAGAPGSPVDANGRVNVSFQGPAFSVAPAPSVPSCMVVFRSGAMAPLSLQNPGMLVAMGGECPSAFWQGTAVSAGQLGLEGLVNIQGLGPCRLPQAPQRMDAAQGCVQNL